VDAKLSTDELKQQLEKLSPEQLEKLHAHMTAQSEHESKILEQDSLYQMDISLKSKYSTAALRVFWKNVDVQPATDNLGGYHILLDGRKVKGFESTVPLRVPTKTFGLAVAKEFSYQTGHMNKLLMPLTDLASGAQMVQASAIAPRLDYLMSFFQTDNCYFRSEAIADKQDAAIKPVAEWFERAFGIETPRIVGLGHPRFTQQQIDTVRAQLGAMQLNQYQVVALCVVAQFTASLMLPLALFHRIVTVDEALNINRMEEGHNTTIHGVVEGFHDIRDADVAVKIAASAAAWDLTAGLPTFHVQATRDITGDEA
jgi:chaperone required for assembly of F1-ATPase